MHNPWVIFNALAQSLSSAWLAMQFNACTIHVSSMRTNCALFFVHIILWFVQCIAPYTSSSSIKTPNLRLHYVTDDVQHEQSVICCNLPCNLVTTPWKYQVASKIESNIARCNNDVALTERNMCNVIWNRVKLKRAWKISISLQNKWHHRFGMAINRQTRQLFCCQLTRWYNFTRQFPHIIKCYLLMPCHYLHCIWRTPCVLMWWAMEIYGLPALKSFCNQSAVSTHYRSIKYMVFNWIAWSGIS